MNEITEKLDDCIFMDFFPMETPSAFSWKWAGGNFEQETCHPESEERDLPFLVAVCPEKGIYRIRHTVSGEIFEGGPGDVLLAPSRLFHTVACPDVCRLHYVHLNFSLDGWMDPLENRKFPGKVSRDMAFVLSSRIDCLVREYLSSDPIQKGKSLFSAMKILEDLLNLSGPADMPRTDFEHRAAVGKAIRFINRHFSEKIKRKDLAKLAGFSETRFHFIFHEITGSAPMEYLMARRIQEAKKKLILSPDSLKNIAEQCGFSDLCYFSRQFHEKTGFAPGTFRNIQRKNLFIVTENKYRKCNDQNFSGG